LFDDKNFNVFCPVLTAISTATGAVVEKRQTGEAPPVFKRCRKKFPRLLLKNFNLFGWNNIE